jgi:hypothetical protein
MNLQSEGPSRTATAIIHRKGQRRPLRGGGHAVVAWRTQNSQNSFRQWKGKKSRFRGVNPRGDKWEARFHYAGKEYYLGLYDSEVEAAMVRDRKAIKLAGKFAVLNFPREAPEQSS